MNQTQLYYLLIIVLLYAATVQQEQQQQQQQQPHSHYSTTMCLQCVNVIFISPKCSFTLVLLALVAKVCFRAHWQKLDIMYTTRAHCI